MVRRTARSRSRLPSVYRRNLGLDEDGPYPWNTIGRVINTCTPTACANYVAASRYDTDQSENALGYSETPKNWQLHEVQDNGEGGSGRKGAGQHPGR